MIGLGAVIAVKALRAPTTEHSFGQVPWRGLLLLIAGSFSLYGWLTVRLVYDQNRNTARALVDPIVRDYHAEKMAAEVGGSEELLKRIDAISVTEAGREYQWRVYSLATDAEYLSASVAAQLANMGGLSEFSDAMAKPASETLTA